MRDFSVAFEHTRQKQRFTPRFPQKQLFSNHSNILPTLDLQENPAFCQQEIEKELVKKCKIYLTKCKAYFTFANIEKPRNIRGEKA